MRSGSWQIDPVYLGNGVDILVTTPGKINEDNLIRGHFRRRLRHPTNRVAGFQSWQNALSTIQQSEANQIEKYDDEIELDERTYISPGVQQQIKLGKSIRNAKYSVRIQKAGDLKGEQGFTLLSENASPPIF